MGTFSTLFCLDEEINNMKLELDKYGIQMPAFSKIGGILANELSVDEAAGKNRYIQVYLCCDQTEALMLINFYAFSMAIRSVFIVPII